MSDHTLDEAGPGPYCGRDDLRAKSFRDRHLEGESFVASDLRGSDFRGAELSGATLESANLSNADFRDSALRGANFRGSLSLSAEMLGGSDLTGAYLPREVAKFTGLQSVEEVSKYLQSIFKIILATCSFALLTVLSMRDENII